MNVVIVGDSQSVNYGDPILTECTKYLVQKLLKEKGIDVTPLVFGVLERKVKTHGERKDVNPHSPHKNSIVSKHVRELRNDIRYLIKWLTNGSKAYQSRLKQSIPSDTRLIVFAGGAMFSGSVQYALAIREIIKYADKNNIKVAFCSVGIERSLNWRTKPIIRRLLKSDNITAFSTRDHVELVPHLTRNKTFYVQTPDSGLFASEAYHVPSQKEDCIGIGLISYEAYLSVAKDEPRVRTLSRIKLYEFWKTLINQLNAKGYKWKLFTNGGTADYRESLSFVDYLGLPREDVLSVLPDTPRMLVEQISEFSLIIGHRLHSLIVGSSFCIPVVPIVWSDKVVSFANMLETPYYWPSPEIASSMVDAIPKLLENNKTDNKVEKLKLKSEEYISKILKDIE